MTFENGLRLYANEHGNVYPLLFDQKGLNMNSPGWNPGSDMEMESNPGRVEFGRGTNRDVLS